MVMKYMLSNRNLDGELLDAFLLINIVNAKKHQQVARYLFDNL
jgi:hypothetical protein